MERIAVVILNYNTWQKTISEIDMISSLFHLKSDQLIVVDNDSGNDSYEQLKKRKADKYHLIRAKNNNGYAAGNNIGMKYAYRLGYQYAWIINNDILIEDAMLLHKMLNILVKDDRLAVVNPDIYAPDGHMFNRESKRPSFYDYTLGMSAYRRAGRQIKDLGSYGYVYRPQGCCMLVDLHKIKEAGYMDEHTFLYGEEVILAERLRNKGYLCGCCTSAKVIHDHSFTVKGAFTKSKLNRMKIESFRYYLRKYRKFSVAATKICCLFYQMKLILLG